MLQFWSALFHEKLLPFYNNTIVLYDINLTITHLIFTLCNVVGGLFSNLKLYTLLYITHVVIMNHLRTIILN